MAHSKLVDSFTVFSMIVGTVDATLHSTLLEMLPDVCQATRSSYGVIRYTAARALASMCNACTSESMLQVIQNVVSHIGDSSDVYNRQGSLESLHRELFIMDHVRV